MRFFWIPLLFAVAGCQPHNPAQVWIAEDGSEAKLKLVDSAPDPF